MTRHFPHPLRFDTLLRFTHPQPEHHFSNPVMIDGDAHACNGWAALKCHRGLWAADDFPEPAAGVVDRFKAIPFQIPEPASLISSAWHELHTFEPMIFRHGIIAPFTRQHRMAATPAVQVDTILVPLSMLQLVARLPRCEFLTPTASTLRIRFSGGLGVLAGLPSATAAFHIDPHHRDHEGRKLAPSTLGKLPNAPGYNWPPVDSTES